MHAVVRSLAILLSLYIITTMSNHIIIVHPKGKRENCVSVLGTLPVLIKGQHHKYLQNITIH